MAISCLRKSNESFCWNSMIGIVSTCCLRNDFVFVDKLASYRYSYRIFGSQFSVHCFVCQLYRLLSFGVTSAVMLLGLFSSFFLLLFFIFLFLEMGMLFVGSKFFLFKITVSNWLLVVSKFLRKNKKKSGWNISLDSLNKLFFSTEEGGQWGSKGKEWNIRDFDFLKFQCELLGKLSFASVLVFPLVCIFLIAVGDMSVTSATVFTNVLGLSNLE